MLETFSRHSLIDLEVQAKGDIHIDYHHLTEDTGIVIGEAVAKALGDRAGILRYGDALIPMDEALTRVALDISNRPYLIWTEIGDDPAEIPSPQRHSVAVIRLNKKNTPHVHQTYNNH